MKNLTISLKTKDGKDPSPKSPVYVRIGSAIKKITGPLSITKNCGWNRAKTPIFRRLLCWLGSHKYLGLDYFVYISKNGKRHSTVEYRCLYCGKMEGKNDKL